MSKPTVQCLHDTIVKVMKNKEYKFCELKIYNLKESLEKKPQVTSDKLRDSPSRLP